MDLLQISHFFPAIFFIEIKTCLAARFIVSNLGTMRSISSICCKLIKLWTPKFSILTKKCKTRGLKRLPLSSTNASSLLSAFIFPSHFECYLVGILVSSLESHNMSKLSHEEETAGLNVMLSTLTHKAFSGRLKTQRLFIFTSVGGNTSSTSARETLRLCFTTFLRISSESFRWQISCCLLLLFQAMQQTAFSWFASNMVFIRSVKHWINWYCQICQLLAFNEKEGFFACFMCYSCLKEQVCWKNELFHQENNYNSRSIRVLSNYGPSSTIFCVDR